VLAYTVGEAVGINPIDPALEDGRHREPPERELQDQRIGPAQFVLFGGDVRALPAAGERTARILRGVEAALQVVIQAVSGVNGGFPAHCVQIGQLHGVASGAQPLDSEILQGAVQGTRFGMGIDDQNIHGRSPVAGHAQDAERTRYIGNE